MRTILFAAVPWHLGPVGSLLPEQTSLQRVDFRPTNIFQITLHGTYMAAARHLGKNSELAVNGFQAIGADISANSPTH